MRRIVQLNMWREMMNNTVLQKLMLDQTKWLVISASDCSDTLSRNSDRAKRQNKQLLLEVSADDPLDFDQDILGLVNLIAIQFNDPMDGRGFSQATILKNVHRFTGEICALGVLPDNIPALRRCGFVSFLLDTGEYFNSNRPETSPGHITEAILLAEKLERPHFDSIGG
ncbi:MAG: DUF934 domain-containing protein [Gammaproteobacteria bacterium]|nr:DUF934 domain-containing protein [Gammaproteobacteria bacterium]